MAAGSSGASFSNALIAIGWAWLAGCAANISTTSALTLRDACSDAHYWDGTHCVATGDARDRVAAGAKAVADFNVDAATAALKDVEAHGPLDHATHVTLWEQRGIAAAYLDDQATADAAFDMLLALDPNHLLSYTLSPKATFVFERARIRAAAHTPPTLELTLPHGLVVGAPVPIDLEVVADPRNFLHRATVFVRARGDHDWHAADVTLAPAGKFQHVTIPSVTSSSKSTVLEIYARAYNQHGDEVFAWATPSLPRDIPLRFEPPTPWYRKWWVWTATAAVLAVATGVTVLEIEHSPPTTVGGTGVVP